MHLPKHLVLSGGGINGIQMLAAISTIESKIQGSLYEKLQLSELSSASVGSFIGLGIILNYTSNEFLDKVIPKTNNYLELFEPMKIVNLFKYYGLTNNDIFTQIVDECISHKFPEYTNESISFKELFDKTHIKFNIHVINITHSTTEVWNYITQPDMPVSFAIKVTSCLPFLFTPILYKDCLYVDGAIIDSIPYKYISNNEDVLYIFLKDKNDNSKILSLGSYINRIFTIMTTKNYCNTCNIQNTIFIEKNKSTFDMNIGYEDLCKFYDSTEINLDPLCFFKVKEQINIDSNSNE